VIRRTTGARITRVLGIVAVVGTTVFLVLLALSDRLAEWQGDALASQEIVAVTPVQAALSPTAFSASLAAREADDLKRAVVYRLRGPDGVDLGGRLPSLAWRFAPMRRFSEGTQRYVLSSARFDDGSELLVGIDVGRQAAALRQQIYLPAAMFALAMLIALVVALVHARRVGDQLAVIAEASKRYLDGDFSQRMPMSPHTGLDGVMADVNRMLERVDRLTSAMRAVADSTAHDLRTPLSRLRARLENALLHGRDRDRLEHVVEGALVDVDRLERTIEFLLRIALAESGNVSLDTIDLLRLVEDLADLYRPLAEEKGQQLVTSLDPGTHVGGNGQLLAQAFANLIDNAIKYTPPGGRIEIGLMRIGQRVAFRVVDNGPGIAVADRERALERSRRLANAVGTEGSGLGLSLVVAVAKLHGARFTLGDNAPGLRADIEFDALSQ
jgi:signal transduction histidine kinase